MRKVTVEIKPNKATKKPFETPLKYLDYIKTINVLKLDFLKNIELIIAEIRPKKGVDIYKAKWPKSLHFFHVLKEANGIFTCLIKVEDRKILGGIMSLYDLDVIWDTPSFLSSDRIVRSCIADEKNLKSFVREMEKHGQIIKISYKSTNYKETNLFSKLTEKQKTILSIAQKEGYYDLPRKINGDGLAKIVGSSKATVLEHLRRIENKIMKNIVE